MSTVQPRARRWSTRISNMSSNAITNPNSAISVVPPNQAYDQNEYTNYQQGENRMIYEITNVMLRPLAFYDLLHELIRPAGLISDGVVGRLNESIVHFQLTIPQADMVAMDQNRIQILLRFCYLETSSEQDDNFPPDVIISANGATVALPPAVSNPNKPNIPPKRPGQHVEITKHCKLNPYVSNSICVKWYVDPVEPSRSYAINVTIAEKVGSDVLLQRIKDRGMSDSESIKRLIADSDTEVATMNLQSSLVCPLGKMRMSYPCKSINCQHIPCFDALFYLQMNEKKPSWICPVCYKPAYYRDLMIDGLFMEILERTPLSVTEVALNLDGSWSPVVKMEQQTSAENPPPEIITISDDED